MRGRTAVNGDADTIGRVLSAAEILFAEKGQDKASLRELTSLAGVNLAAVNYHFGSKDALAEAVFDRLSARVNKQRTEALSRCVAIARKEGRPPRLKDILETFIEPYVGLGSEQTGVLLARFLLQHRVSPSPLTRRILRKHFDPMAKLYIEALGEACPGIDAPDIVWRYIFMSSAVVFSVVDSRKDNRVARLSGGAADASEREDFRTALLHFLHGAFSAGT